MASFTKGAEKLMRRAANQEKKITLNPAEKIPMKDRNEIPITRKAFSPAEVEDLELTNKYTMIALEFLKLSGSFIDTCVLTQSWLTYKKINIPTYKAIMDKLNSK